jgi:hypothetical protein
LGKVKKDKYKNLISIFKEKSKLEPFFHKLDIEYKSERFMLLNKENNNTEIYIMLNIKFIIKLIKKEKQ